MTEQSTQDTRSELQLLEHYHEDQTGDRWQQGLKMHKHPMVPDKPHKHGRDGESILPGELVLTDPVPVEDPLIGGPVYPAPRTEGFITQPNAVETILEGMRAERSEDEDV